jgi:dTDP-4-amino-4,6-dideoxygalactose transaminase
MQVPLADLHAQYLSIKQEIDDAVAGVIGRSQFILGDAVTAFERDFARHHHVRHCVAVGSGTDALHAALWAAGVGAGDGVITTPFTFAATAEAIALTGARPVFVDIEPDCFTMDAAKLAARLEEGPDSLKAVIPVHLYGQAANMGEIVQISGAAGLRIIEDACQAHAARLGGTFVGGWGESAAFSFYPGKNLGAWGEAGAVVTNDDEVAALLRRIRDHGQAGKYVHAMIGHNYRMDGLQGAVLGVKLRYLDTWTERRRALASHYHESLRDTGDLVLPAERNGAFHVYHLFVVRSGARSRLQAYLAEKGIGTAVAYPVPLHLQEAYSYLGYRKGSFPESERASEECLSLPVYAEMSDAQAAYVVDNVRAFYRDHWK